MPFHIRLINEPAQQSARPDAEPATKSVVIVEFLQGIAFGLGVALIGLAAFWLVRINGLMW